MFMRFVHNILSLSLSLSIQPLLSRGHALRIIHEHHTHTHSSGKILSLFAKEKLFSSHPWPFWNLFWSFAREFLEVTKLSFRHIHIRRGLSKSNKWQSLWSCRWCWCYLSLIIDYLMQGLIIFSLFVIDFIISPIKNHFNAWAFFLIYPSRHKNPSFISSIKMPKRKSYQKMFTHTPPHSKWPLTLWLFSNFQLTRPSSLPTMHGTYERKLSNIIFGFCVTTSKKKTFSDISELFHSLSLPPHINKVQQSSIKRRS